MSIDFPDIQVFILVTSEKIETMVEDKISRFHSYDDIIIRYTTAQGKVSKKDNDLLRNKLTRFGSETTYMYMTEVTASQLVLFKLTYPHVCKVFVTTKRFINTILPLLDLLRRTTSSLPSVEVDVWVSSTPASSELASIVKDLQGRNIDAKALMKRAVTLYNHEAPKALAEINALRQKQLKAGVEPILISRFNVAMVIRDKLITENIIPHSHPI